MKHNLNNNSNKNNSKVTTAATLFTVAIILVFATTSTMTPLTAQASRFGGGGEGFIDPITSERKAPSVVTGDNIYIAWWANNTGNGNEEVMFRASTDGGATFGDRINLSNTTDADSIDAEIAAEGANVIVTWWEHNQTGSDIPVARISEDAGETFGPLLMLGTNGTIGVTEEGAEAVEEAVEEATAGEGGE
jgi:hypothetical protein